MARDYSPVLSEILLTLKNINDNIKRVEDEIFDINKRLESQNIEKPEVLKHQHIIMIKGYDKTKGGEIK